MSSSEPDRNRGFDPSDLESSVIAIPLLRRMQEQPEAVHNVLIALHRDYLRPEQAAQDVSKLIKSVIGEQAADNTSPAQAVVDERKISQYVVARLTADSIRELVRRDQHADRPPAVYHIWPDFEVNALINKSAATIKADAARIAFAATGTGIVWAVVDSGIDGKHPHFAAHHTLAHSEHLRHKDFTFGGKSPCVDTYGHGSHVAGIIAGDSSGFSQVTPPREPVAIRAQRDENNDTAYFSTKVDNLAGMAPSCQLVSYKVLDDQGRGESTAIIAALQHIQRVNNYGDTLRIHGVNLSVGYDFDPTWFACGQSPLCLEVTRLVHSGVVVVVAAGNTGYGYHLDYAQGNVAASQGQTINDPGNTETAITVGSTHRDMPHTYGVSYFSSKGPTGDGRAKPDIIAPGERILSCAAGAAHDKMRAKTGMPRCVDYVEDSGTSMAAAHVSGVIAAFLSIRPEYIGRPDEVKKIFMSTATDLGRVRDFQGAGLVDLMRAIQAV